MGRKKENYKIGDTISFRFAGSNESGSIVDIRGEGNDIRYMVFDGSYRYPVKKDQII